jgi:hypothetical protein
VTLIEYCKQTGCNNQSQDQQQSCDENDEWIVITDADAVVDPGTVMVKTFNTSVADGTVFAASRANHFAVRTHLTGMHFAK